MPGTGGSYAKRLLMVVSLGWAMIYAANTALYPLLPAIGVEFHLSNTEVGALASLYFVPYVGVQFLAGPLVDRLGTKWVLVSGFLVASLGLLGLALAASDYVTTAAMVALYGLGAGAYFPVSYGVVAQAVSERTLGMSTSVMVLGMAIGMVSGLSLSGPLLLVTGSWRTPFLALAISTLLCAVVFNVFVRDVKIVRPPTVSLMKMLSDRKLLVVYGTFVCSLYGWWVVVTFGPSYLQTERGFGVTFGGMVTAAVAVTGIVGSRLAGRLSDSYGRRKVAMMLFALASIVLGILGYVGSWILVIAALLGYGLVGKLAYDAVGFAWIGGYARRRHPSAVATAMGAAGVSVLVSSLAAPLLSGWIRDVTGSFSGAFYLAAVVLFVGVPLSRLGEETIDRSSDQNIGSGEESHVSIT